MELSINNNLQPLRFRFENTKHKLGVRIWGDRRSFHELHELLGECWDCENADMSRAEECSYIGVISYFSYEARHAFMGDRLVTLDGKPVKEWSDEVFQLFEKQMECFEVGMELSWPHMLFIMSSWWECLRHQVCPMRVMGIMREFTENIEQAATAEEQNAIPQDWALPPWRYLCCQSLSDAFHGAHQLRVSPLVNLQQSHSEHPCR